MKNLKQYKAEISLPYGNKINVKYIYTNPQKDEFEIVYNNTSKHKVKNVESFNYLRHSELLECEETVCELETISRLLKFTLVNYLKGRYTFKETRLFLGELTYHIELFGVETYNGWDIDCVKECCHTTKKAALIDILMYCIVKIHFTIEGLNKLKTK